MTEALPVEEEKALSEQTGEEKMEEKAEVAEDKDIDKTEESSE